MVGQLRPTSLPRGAVLEGEEQCHCQGEKNGCHAELHDNSDRGFLEKLPRSARDKHQRNKPRCGNNEEDHTEQCELPDNVRSFSEKLWKKRKVKNEHFRVRDISNKRHSQWGHALRTRHSQRDSRCVARRPGLE